jgi:pimeloyl-ACP methyl ester carboxylesterase
MPFATTRDNVRLHYEEVGSGTPIVFVHEFAGDWRAWEPQMRYFARRYRCVTFSFRGYHPSDIPPEKSSYGYEKFRDDVIAVMDHLKIDKAHVCGLSMGGYATLNVGMTYPQRALSLTMAGTGSGSEHGVLEESVREPLRQGRRQHVARLSGRPPAGLRVRGGDQEDHASRIDHLRRRRRRLHRAEHLSQADDRDSGPRDVSQERPHGEHRGTRAVQSDARRIPRAGRLRTLGRARSKVSAGGEEVSIGVPLPREAAPREAAAREAAGRGDEA